MNDLSSPAAAAGNRIAAHAFVEARLSEIGALRNRPAPSGGPTLPTRFLRHADEHTVVGMHAVLDAIAGSAGSSALASLHNHAVVAAPCQSWRLVTARSLATLATGGAAVVTPHIVPQCSLHSVAGAVSVALGMHGPHLGVGGGPDALGEGFLAATSLLLSCGDPACNAVWLVATEWDEEPVLDAAGSPTNDPVCRAIAMLLEPMPHVGGGGRELPLSLAVRVPRQRTPGSSRPAATSTFVALASVLGLHGEDQCDATATFGCPGGVEVDVMRRPQGCSVREAA